MPFQSVPRPINSFLILWYFCDTHSICLSFCDTHSICFTILWHPFNLVYHVCDTHSICFPFWDTHSICFPLCDTHSICLPFCDTHSICLPFCDTHSICFPFWDTHSICCPILWYPFNLFPILWHPFNPFPILWCPFLCWIQANDEPDCLNHSCQSNQMEDRHLRAGPTSWWWASKVTLVSPLRTAVPESLASNSRQFVDEPTGFKNNCSYVQWLYSILLDFIIYIQILNNFKSRPSVSAHDLLGPVCVSTPSDFM